MTFDSSLHTPTLTFKDAQRVMKRRYLLFVGIVLLALLFGACYVRGTERIYRVQMTLMPNAQYAFSTLKGVTNQVPQLTPLGRLLYYMQAQDFIASLREDAELMHLLPSAPPPHRTFLHNLLHLPMPTAAEQRALALTQFIKRIRLIADPLYQGYFLQIEDSNPAQARKILELLYNRVEQYFGAQMAAENNRQNRELLLEAARVPPAARPLLFEAYAYNLLQINTFKTEQRYFGKVISKPETPLYVWPNVPLIFAVSGVLGICVGLLVIFTKGCVMPVVQGASKNPFIGMSGEKENFSETQAYSSVRADSDKFSDAVNRPRKEVFRDALQPIADEKCASFPSKAARVLPRSRFFLQPFRYARYKQ